MHSECVLLILECPLTRFLGLSHIAEWQFGKPSFPLSLLKWLVLEWRALCGVHLGHPGLQGERVNVVTLASSCVELGGGSLKHVTNFT